MANRGSLETQQKDDLLVSQRTKKTIVKSTSFIDIKFILTYSCFFARQIDNEKLLFFEAKGVKEWELSMDDKL